MRLPVTFKGVGRTARSSEGQDSGLAEHWRLGQRCQRQWPVPPRRLASRGGCADRHLPLTWQDPSWSWLSGVEPAGLCGASALNPSYDNQLQESVPSGPLVTNAAFTEWSL